MGQPLRNEDLSRPAAASTSVLSELAQPTKSSTDSHNDLAIGTVYRHVGRILHFVSTLVENPASTVPLDCSRIRWLCKLGVHHIEDLYVLNVAQYFAEHGRKYVEFVKSVQAELAAECSKATPDRARVIQLSQQLDSAQLSFQRNMAVLSDGRKPAVRNRVRRDILSGTLLASAAVVTGAIVGFFLARMRR